MQRTDLKKLHNDNVKKLRVGAEIVTYAHGIKKKGRVLDIIEDSIVLDCITCGKEAKPQLIKLNEINIVAVLDLHCAD